VVVLKVDFTARDLHELRCRYMVGQRLVGLNLGLGDGIDKRVHELEEGIDIPRDCLCC
jgi:hypothetical protein